MLGTNKVVCVVCVFLRANISKFFISLINFIIKLNLSTLFFFQHEVNIYEHLFLPYLLYMLNSSSYLERFDNGYYGS